MSSSEEGLGPTVFTIRLQPRARVFNHPPGLVPSRFLRDFEKREDWILGWISRDTCAPRIQTILSPTDVTEHESLSPPPPQNLDDQTTCFTFLTKPCGSVV